MAKSQDQDIPAHSQRYEKWISTGKEPHEKKKCSPHWPFFSRFYHNYFFKKKFFLIKKFENKFIF